MEITDTGIMGTGLEGTHGLGTPGEHKGIVQDKTDDPQKDGREKFDVSNHTASALNRLRWDKHRQNQSEYTNLDNKDILTDKSRAENKNILNYVETSRSPWSILGLGVTSDHRLWSDDEMSEKNENYGNRCTLNEKGDKVNRSEEQNKHRPSVNKPGKKLKKQDFNFESTSKTDDDLSLFERQLQQLEKETTDKFYRLKFKSWNNRREQLQKLDQNKVKKSKSTDEKNSCELIPSKEKSISSNHPVKYHIEQKERQVSKSKFNHVKKNHNQLKSEFHDKSLNFHSKEESAVVGNLSVTSCNTPKSANVLNRVDVNKDISRVKEQYEITHLEHDDLKHIDKTNEKNERSYKRFYRLQHSQWKCSSKCALRLLKRKYYSVRVLFAKEPIIVLDSLDIDRYKMIGENFEVISMWETETDSSVSAENGDPDKRDHGDGVNLVDPRVMSLSRTLQSGQNGKVGAEKTFKNLSSRHTQAKTKVCFKLEAGKKSNYKKPVVQKPDWSMLKQKLKEVNDKQILKKIKNSKDVGKEFNKYSKSKQNQFQNKINDLRKPGANQESINSEIVDESVIQERKRELEKLCSRSDNDTEDVNTKQEVDENSAFCDKLGEIQEMLSDSDVELDSDFKIDGYSIELCHHSTDDDRSKEPSVERDLVSEEVKPELIEESNKDNDQSTLSVTSGIIPNLYVSDNMKELQMDDRSLSPPILVKECDNCSDYREESDQEYRYMIKEETDIENESCDYMETAECGMKPKELYSNDNECKAEVESSDVNDEVKCSSNDIETNSEINSNCEALDNNTSNSGDNTQYLNSQSAAPEQGLNRDCSLSPVHTSFHPSHTGSTAITSDAIQSNMSSSLTDAVLSDSAETLNYSDLLDDEMCLRNVEGDSETDSELMKIERELLSLPNDVTNLSKTDDTVRQWKTLSLSSSSPSTSSISSDNENSTCDGRLHNTQAMDKSCRSANTKNRAISDGKHLSGNKTREKLKFLKDGTLRTNVQELECFKSKNDVKMEKKDKSVSRQSSEGDVLDKLGKTSKKRKKSHDKNNLQDLEDLPKISPPKRRQRPYSVGSYRQSRDLTQERLMQDLPNHNWLFNKYNALSTEQKPMGAENERNDPGTPQESKEQMEESISVKTITKGGMDNTMADHPPSTTLEGAFNKIIEQTFPNEDDMVESMTGQSITKGGLDDARTSLTFPKGLATDTKTGQPPSEGWIDNKMADQSKVIQGIIDLTSDQQPSKTGIEDKMPSHALTKEGITGMTNQQLENGSTDNTREATMPRTRKFNNSDSLIEDVSTSERQTGSQSFNNNQNESGNFKKRLINGKSKQDLINSHYNVGSKENAKNSTGDTIKYTKVKMGEIALYETATRPVTTHKSSENEHIQNSLTQRNDKEKCVSQSSGKIQEDSISIETESVVKANDPKDIIDLTRPLKTGLEPVLEYKADVLVEDRRCVSVDDIVSVTKHGKKDKVGQDDKSITEKKVCTGSDIEEMECTALDTDSAEKYGPIKAECQKEPRFSEPLTSASLSPSVCPTKQHANEDSGSLNVRQKPQPPVLRVQPRLCKPPGGHTAIRTELESSPFESLSSIQLSNRDPERHILASGNQLESSRTNSSADPSSLNVEQHYSSVTDQNPPTDVRVPVRLSSGLPVQSSTDVSPVPSLLSSNSHARNTNTGMVNPVQPFIQTTVFNHPRQTQTQTSHIPVSTSTLTSSSLTTNTSTQVLIPRAVVPLNPTTNVLLNQTQTNQSQVNRQEQALITVQNAPQVFEINPVTPLQSANQVILLNNSSSVIPINTISNRNSQTLGPQVLSGVQASQEQQQFGQILSSSQIIIAQPIDTRIANNSVTMVESVPRVNTVNKSSHTVSVDQIEGNNTVLMNEGGGERRGPSDNTQRITIEVSSSSDDDDDFKRQMEEIEKEIKRKQKEQDEIKRKKMELLEKRKAAKSGLKVRTEDAPQDTIKDEQDHTVQYSNKNTESVKMANTDQVSRSDANVDITNNEQNARVADSNISNTIHSSVVCNVPGVEVCEESQNNSQGNTMMHTLERDTEETNNTDDEEDQFEGALVIDLSATSKEYAASNMNGSQTSNLISSQKSNADKIKIEKESEIKSFEDKDNIDGNSHESKHTSSLNDDCEISDLSLSKSEVTGDVNENSLPFIQDIGRINPFTGEYDLFDDNATNESLDLTSKSNKGDKNLCKSNQETNNLAAEFNQDNRQDEMQTDESISDDKVEDMNSRNSADCVENNDENSVSGHVSNKKVDLTYNNDVNGLDLSAKPICVFTFKKEVDSYESNQNASLVENTNYKQENNLSNNSESKDNQVSQGNVINRAKYCNEQSSVITSKATSAALSALNQNNTKQDINSENDKHRETDSKENMIYSQSESSTDFLQIVRPEQGQHDTEKSINLSAKVNSIEVSASDANDAIVMTTESIFQVVTSGSQTVTSTPMAGKTSVTSSFTLVTSPSKNNLTNVTICNNEIQSNPQIPETAPLGPRANPNFDLYPPPPHHQQSIRQEQQVSPSTSVQSREHEPTQRQRDSVHVSGILPFQCRPSLHMFEQERRNDRGGWWHPQLKVQQHTQRRTRGMFIELEPAHSRPRQMKIPRGARPVPAHNQIVNMKEVFKKMNKSHCIVPLIIQQSCPYFRRTNPIHEPPEDILVENRVKPDMGTIQQAHLQKPFSVAGQLIVSRKRTLKRSASRGTISPSPTRFASMPNTPPSPPERIKRSSSAMADIPLRQCEGALDSPLPNQRPNSLEPVCPARAHTGIDDLDYRSFSTIQTLKPPATFRVDERKSNDQSLEIIDLTRLESPKREVIDAHVVAPQINQEIVIQNEVTAAMAKRQKLDTTRKTSNPTCLNLPNNRPVINPMRAQLPPPIQSHQNRMPIPVSRPPRSRQPDYSRPRQVLAPVPIDRPLQPEVGSQRLLHEAMFSPANRSDPRQADVLARQSNYTARRMEFAQRMNNTPNDHLAVRRNNQQGDSPVQTMDNKQRDNLVQSMHNRTIHHLSDRLENSPNNHLTQRPGLNQRVLNRQSEFLAERMKQGPSPEKIMETRPNNQPFQRLDYRQSEQVAQRTGSRLHERPTQRVVRPTHSFTQPTNYRLQPPKLIQPNSQQYQSHVSYTQQIGSNRASNQQPEMMKYPDRTLNAAGMYPQARQGSQQFPFHAQQTMVGSNQGNQERVGQQHIHAESFGHLGNIPQHNNMSDQQHTMSDQQHSMSGFPPSMSGHQRALQMESMQGSRPLNNQCPQHNQRPMMSTSAGAPLPNTRGEAAPSWSQIQKMQQIRANHIRNRQLQQNNQMNRDAVVRQGNPAMGQLSPPDHLDQGPVPWAGYQHSPTQLQAVTQISPTGHFQNIEQVLRHPSRFPAQHTQQSPGSHMNFPHRRASELIDTRQPPPAKYYHLGPPDTQFVTSTNPVVIHQNQPSPNWSQAQMTHQAQMEAQMYNQGVPKQQLQAPPNRATEGPPGMNSIKMKSPHMVPPQGDPKLAYSSNTCLTSQHQATSQYQGHGVQGQGQTKDMTVQQEQLTVQPKQSGSPDQSAQTVEENLPHLQQVHGTCVLCGKYSLYLCSSCKKMWYCSPECQLTHWQTHANECKGPDG